MALKENLEKQGQWLFRNRSYLPLLILLPAIFFYVRTEINPRLFFLEDTRWEVWYNSACLLVGLLGLAIRIYTVGHTPKNTSGRNVKGQLADELNTTGIYSAVRHPLYLGNFFMWLGPALLTGNFWFVLIFCLLYWLYYERIMFAEEHFLREKFGAQYTSWADHVPSFIPRFKNFQPPKYTFSWKKVLKKEKNGLVALFILFCFFNFLGKWIEQDAAFDWYDWFILIACIFTVLAYLVLKYLKKRTTLLEDARQKIQIR